MERGDASARARTPDASSLGVTAFNVGMIQETAFTGKKHKAGTQDANLNELAGHAQRWLEDGVVGLNEIHPSLVPKLVKKLEERGLDVINATNDSNSLLWRLSSLFT